MAQKDRVTQQNPRTGASASEQTAHNGSDAGVVDSIGMGEQNKQIFNLINEFVVRSNEQFGDNLRFNSETLTNVLYSRLVDILSERFNSDDFVNQVVDDLIDNGHVYSSDDSSAQPLTKDDIGQQEYDDLLQKVYSIIEQVNAHKPKLLASLSELKESVSGQTEEFSAKVDQFNAQISQREELINRLRSKLDSQKQKVDDVVSSQVQSKKEFEGELSTIYGVLQNSYKTGQNKSIKGQQLIGKTTQLLQRIRITDSKKQSENNRNKRLIVSQTNALLKNSSSFKKLSIGKKTIGQKIKGRLKVGMRAIANSPVGKTFSVGKKIVGAGFGVLKTTAKVAASTAKGFYKASKFTGTAIVSAGKALTKFAKNSIKTKGQNVVKSVISGSLSTAITKAGFKLIKFIGKKIWSGVKKMFFAAVGALTKLFSIGIGFVNKISTYTKRIGKGVKNAIYRFLIDPISAILVTVFGMVMSVVMQPVNFMKNIFPSIFTRIHDSLSSIAQSSKRVLKKTWGTLKRILKHPLTITMIIGAIAFMVFPKVRGWITNIFVTIKDCVISTVTWLATTGWKILKVAWDITITVGKFLFDVVEFVTNPKGFIAKTIMFIFNTVRMLKKCIYDMCAVTGRDSVEVLCMFLAGDYIGLAIKMFSSLIGKLWQRMKRYKLFNVMLNAMNAFVGFYIMEGKIMLNLTKMAWFALKHPIKFAASGPFKQISKVLVDPIKEWWKKVQNIWISDWDSSDIPVGDPTETISETTSAATNAVAKLRMKGKGSLAVAKMDQWMSFKGWASDKGVLQRLQGVAEICETNTKHINNFNEFLKEVWELGKGNPQTAQDTLKVMLESPELSQKLLSAFYYYDPKTNKLMSILPTSYIDGVLKNIRTLVSGDGDWEGKFKTVVETFDQANKERANIVQHQSQALQKFADDLNKIDVNNIEDLTKMREMMVVLRDGKLFEGHANMSLKYMKQGRAATENVTSITGDTLGQNAMFKVSNAESYADNLPPSKFEVGKVNKKQGQVGNIVLPPSLSQKPTQGEVTAEEDEQDVKSWREHLQAVRDASKSGMSQKEMDEKGLVAYTYTQYKEMMKEKRMKKMTPEELKAHQDDKELRMKGLRLAADIQAYNMQGKDANVLGFDLGKKPSILRVYTDGLKQDMYMFSPQWMQVQGASKISDDELLLQIDSQDKEAAARIRKAREEARQEKLRKEKEERRRQQILDYSAKVSGGFIEVKIGEDVEAMREAWHLHLEKVRQASKSGMSQDEMDKRGLVAYNWEQWKVYYRKMHGLPEDGIKRIPFDGKRKERNIDFGPRKALSEEEMSKYGIRMSKDGPVMISLDQAMKVTKQLLDQAKSIYSIRDGLEVMRQGLDSETEVLKKRNEGGVPVTIAQRTSGGEQPMTTSAPASSSVSSSD